MTAKNAPGKAFRKGISLIDLFEMFPDDTTAEALVRQVSLAGRCVLRPLRER